MLRLMTYNIRHGLGTDRRVSLSRVAEVIRRASPDVVALQEMDAGRARSGGVHQPEALAAMLAMTAIFCPALDDDRGRYGIAVLSRLPARLVKCAPLPGRAGAEPRCALWVRVQHRDARADLITTHLSRHPRDRHRQAKELLGPGWLGDAGPDAVLCGDLNTGTGSFTYRRLAAHLGDPLRDAGAARATWPSRRPLVRLDHILCRGRLTARAAGCRTDATERRASDHLPVVADLERAEVPPGPRS